VIDKLVRGRQSGARPTGDRVSPGQRMLISRRCIVAAKRRPSRGAKLLRHEPAWVQQMALKEQRAAAKSHRAAV